MFLRSLQGSIVHVATSLFTLRYTHTRARAQLQECVRLAEIEGPDNIHKKKEKKKNGAIEKKEGENNRRARTKRERFVPLKKIYA